MKRDLFGQVTTPQMGPESLGRRDHLTFRGNVTQGRHGWLRLTPAYSLHTVEEILRQCCPDDIVLDPFSGTATTGLVAATLGIQCHSVEINPFLVWLGNLKTRRFHPDTAGALRSAAKRIVGAVRKREAPGQPWVPNIHGISKWWDPNTLNALARLLDRVHSGTEKAKPDVVDLLKVAFCRVMIQTADVTFGHQSMSFKKRRHDQELPLFVGSELGEMSEDVWAHFLKESNEVADTLSAQQPQSDATVLLGDSRDLRDVLPRADYTTVLTSPPYPNRMSYIRELRPYMYWLRYLTNGRQAGELDWRAIGGTWGCATSLLGMWQPSAKDSVAHPDFNRIIAEIADSHKILARYVHKYFEDIGQHIESLRHVLASGARCYYVVGNSKFYETLVPVHEIYAALFAHAGFLNVQTEVIRKRTSKKELYEYIVRAEVP